MYHVVILQHAITQNPAIKILNETSIQHFVNDGGEVDWGFRISDVVKTSDGTDI